MILLFIGLIVSFTYFLTNKKYYKFRNIKYYIEKEFCAYCDYGHNGLKNCSPLTKEIYGSRGESCGFAGIEGVRMIMTKNSVIIALTEQEFNRNDIDNLREAIAEQRKYGGAPWRAPKESVIEKVLSD